MNIPLNVQKLMNYERNLDNNLYRNGLIKWKPRSSKLGVKYKDFSPEVGKWFKVKSYWLPLEAVTYFQDISTLNSYFIKEKKILFLIHPIMTYDFQGIEEGPIFNALATSSIRTVLVYPENNIELLFFAKLSLFKDLFKREISIEEAQFSITVNQLLNFCKSDLPKNFRHFPEVLSVYSKFSGMIIREIPKELLKCEVEIIPMFSLYIPQRDGTILISEMIKKQNISVLMWIRKYIICPFVKESLHLYIKNGIMFESHAQNLLLEIIDGNATGIFYHRDMDGSNFEIKNKIKYPENITSYYENTLYADLEQSPHDYLLIILFAISLIKDLNVSYKDLFTIFKEELEKELLYYNTTKYDINEKNVFPVIKKERELYIQKFSIL